MQQQADYYFKEMLSTAVLKFYKENSLALTMALDGAMCKLKNQN